MFLRRKKEAVLVYSQMYFLCAIHFQQHEDEDLSNNVSLGNLRTCMCIFFSEMIDHLITKHANVEMKLQNLLRTVIRKQWQSVIKAQGAFIYSYKDKETIKMSKFRDCTPTVFCQNDAEGPIAKRP